MKKLLVFIVVFLVIGFSVQYLFETVFIEGNKSSPAYKVYKITSVTSTDEVPIFGDSRALTSFVPSILGKNYFNYGMKGIGENVVAFCLENECKKVKRENMIIVTMKIFGISSTEIADKSAYIQMARKQDVKDLLGKEFAFYYDIPIIKYFGSYEYYFRDYLKEHSGNSIVYVDNGAIIDYKKSQPFALAGAIKQRSKDSTEFNVNPVLLNHYISIFKHNPNKIFVLVLPPYHKAYFNNFKNYPEAMTVFNSLAKMPNVRLLNYTHLNYPDEYFLNTTHLTYEGATAFSKMIKDTLNKINTDKFR